MICSSVYSSLPPACAVFELNRESRSLPVSCLGVAWVVWHGQSSISGFELCEHVLYFSSSSPNSANSLVFELNRESSCAVTAFTTGLHSDTGEEDGHQTVSV
ncbi:unnamed protein product [Polarella glacialis]|uniref:Uncharacterized protein n=1 Tax=Polarella glacialis TaxID=89957 RepID=A0A813IAQ8_POLGL|nr:unnamed protein product [Polarella glacialis]CAE8607401.1 unnamed protein product [Polarella glacialis]CAE8648245.1 unnamed protein product [Polarella glacialis]